MSYLTYYFKDLFNGVLVFIGLLNLINKWPAKKTQSQIPLPNNWKIIAGLHYSMQNASFTLAKTVYDIPSIIQRTYEKKYFNSQKTNNNSHPLMNREPGSTRSVRPSPEQTDTPLLVFRQNTTCNKLVENLH